MVTFLPVENWVIGDDNVIKYVMPFDLEDAGNDWVGVFKVSVEMRMSLFEYINVVYDSYAVITLTS